MKQDKTNKKREGTRGLRYNLLAQHLALDSIASIGRGRGQKWSGEYWTVNVGIRNTICSLKPESVSLPTEPWKAALGAGKPRVKGWNTHVQLAGAAHGCSHPARNEGEWFLPRIVPRTRVALGDPQAHLNWVVFRTTPGAAGSSVALGSFSAMSFSHFNGPETCFLKE